MADDEVVAFLGQNGAVEILVWLVDGAKTFTELYERVDIARATLSKRLKRGVELDLWRVSPGSEPDQATAQTYQLASQGDVLAEVVEDLPIHRHLQSLYNARQDFEADRADLIQQVATLQGEDKTE